MKNHVVHANVLHELHGLHGYFLVEKFVVTTDANFPFTLIGNMSESSQQRRVREMEWGMGGGLAIKYGKLVLFFFL